MDETKAFAKKDADVGFSSEVPTFVKQPNNAEVESCAEAAATSPRRTLPFHPWRASPSRDYLLAYGRKTSTLSKGALLLRESLEVSKRVCF